MTHPTGAQPDGTTTGRSCLKRWHLLLCCALWAVVSLGCATASYVTEVFRGSDNTDKANVTLTIEIDTGVFAAIQAIDPNLLNNLEPADAQDGLMFLQTEGGRKLILRREFASVPELQSFPASLTSASDGGEVVVKATAVQMHEIAGTVEYTFTATVEMPKPESASFAGDVNLFFSDMLPEDQDSAEYKELKSKLDALSQALTKAGPPKFVVEVVLPGTIQASTLNGQPGGERITDSHVRWTLTQDKPGIYVVSAVAKPLSATEAEELMRRALETSGKLDEFKAIVNPTQDQMEAAKAAADEAWEVFNQQLGTSVAQETEQRIKTALRSAVFLSSFKDNQGKSWMPGLNAAMPIILKLGIKASNNDNALTALERLTSLMIGHDANRLRERQATTK
jgi:hypothetical protein